MKLLLDEMYPRRLAEQLRADGHDVVAVVELAELVGGSDAEVTRFARESGRVVVTENVIDYARLDVGEHAGLLLVTARRWPRTPKSLPRLRKALRTRLEDRTTTEVPLIEWL